MARPRDARRAEVDRHGLTDRGVRFSNEGMAIRDGILFLLPEDDPSRLFRYRLP
jgi:hypothetical protein